MFLCIEIFLSFRIFEQLALALKAGFALSSLYWIYIFYHSGFLSNLRLPWKQSFPWNFSRHGGRPPPRPPPRRPMILRKQSRNCQQIKKKKVRRTENVCFTEKFWVIHVSQCALCRELNHLARVNFMRSRLFTQDVNHSVKKVRERTTRLLVLSRSHRRRLYQLHANFAAYLAFSRQNKKIAALISTSATTLTWKCTLKFSWD